MNKKGRLILFFIVFFIAPVYAIFIHGFSPDKLNYLQLIIVLGTYWFFPWLLCITLLFRNQLFFLIYFFQCFFLILHSSMFNHLMPFELEICRYVFIFCMLYMGFLFIKGDSSGISRKGTRFEINTNVELIGKNGTPILATLQDCSSSGLGIKISNENYNNHIKSCTKGDKYVVILKNNSQVYEINCWVIWCFHYGSFWRIGFMSDNVDALTAFIESHLKKDITLSLNDILRVHFSKSGYLLWILFIALSYSIPIFSKFIK